jgi:alpha-tubulin suppressor-like RCC1 family protein
VVLAALAGCAGIERQGPPGADGALVHLLKDSLSLTLDLAEHLGVTRTDADGQPAPARLRWRSGNRAIALVDSTGVVTAVGLGRTWIEVSDTRHSDTAIVNTYLQLTAIHAGDDFSCALTGGGKAACWGRNAFGSLGDGQSFDRVEPDLVDGLRRFTSLSVGAGSACGLSVRLYCWGYNGVGQLGDGTTTERDRPVVVADTLDIARVLLGAGTTTCAFERASLVDGPGASGPTGAPALLCWGWNGFGQMLDGGGVNPHRPKRVDAGRQLVTFATGGHHICGLDTAGGAWCWGRNDEGQLGDGTAVDRHAPVLVAGAHSFAMLAAGIAHTCGRTAAGQVWCWGSDAYAQLGSGAGTALTPALAAGGLTFDTLVTSAYHTCGLRSGIAWCWGDNDARQLGRASGNQPAPVAGALNFTSISAGRNHTCGIGTDGFAYCWGGNLHGQLGAPAAPDGYSPVRVGGQQ